MTGPGPGIPQVWVAGERRQPRRLGQGEDPLLSPNGRLVAAASNQGPRALIIYSSTGARAGFFDLSMVSATPLAWSPDSRYLAVVAGGYVATSTGPSLPASPLFVIDTRTDKVTKIADGVAAGASFAPGRSDRLVYGSGRSSSITGLLNLYAANPDGTAITRLTHDGHSLNPVWGRRGIVFDRELRPSKYQIFLYAHHHTGQITDIQLSRQDQGLVPVALSADGTRLVARFESFTNPQTRTVNLADGRVHALTGPRTPVTSLSISGDGRRVLIGTLHKVETVPFTGGAPTVLVRNASQPSWNQ